MTEVTATAPVMARVIANFGATVAVAPLAQEPLSRSPQVGEAEGGAGSAVCMHSLQKAHPLKSVPMLVAGDQVHCEHDEAAAVWRVVELLPRSSVLERPDRRQQQRPLAANLTHLAIISASEPGIDTLLIDQFCVAAHRAGVDALVVINKSDLLHGANRSEAEATLSVYAAAGYPTAMINTTSSEGIAPLLEQLVGRSVTLVGASGAGKSSIVQRLLPDRELRIGAISAATGFGAHTTSVTYWYALPGQASIIDSPGVRQYPVSHLNDAVVRQGYPEFVVLADECRFGNCTHTVEPHCAVLDALAAGDVSAWRYANYLKLIAEA